ncbi:MAG: multiheme c-type cytochrome [Sulfurimonas sp.]
MQKMKTLLISAATLLTTQLFGLSNFQSSKTCQKCHPLIYKEHLGSQHKKASIFSDPIHKAVWDAHPLKKKELYKCAKCHTPNNKEAMAALKEHKKYLPQDNSASREGVSCVSCHKIESIKHNKASNTNILTKDTKKLFSARESEKSVKNKKFQLSRDFFGMVTKKSGSPYHDIDFSNELFYNGNVCMGCHSHKENAHKLKVCDTKLQEHPNTKETNCISCHMPQVKGSFTTMYDSKTHRYHGFSGSIHQAQMLAKYVTIEMQKNDVGFDILITNKANHALLLHPLRIGELQVSIDRNGKTSSLKPVQFVRILGKEDHPAPPWIADKILKDTQIQAKEQRKIHFDYKLQKGDRLSVALGHYIISTKVAKKFGLDEDLTKFILLKEEHFDVK